MKTIKSKIMAVYQEINEDNSCSFANRRFFKEYLGGMVINYRRKSDKKLIMKIYKTKSKKGAEIFIDNTFYFLTVIEGVIIIYNEYGKAVSITYSDGYEWIGESVVSEDNILEENNFRIKYQKFINEINNSKDLAKIYNDNMDLLQILANNTFMGDTDEISRNLKDICNHLHNIMNNYFDHSLNNIKNISTSIEYYYTQEEEKEKALSSLKDYYEWLLNVEKTYKNSLNSNDLLLTMISETKNYIDEFFKKTDITQDDWDLLKHYHDELEKMLNNSESKVKENLSEDNSQKEKKETKNKFNLFKRSNIEEKTDYLTFKTLRKYAVDDYQFDAEKISIKNAKKELKKFNKTQNKYEKLIDKDQNEEIDYVSYAVYNTIKSAQKDLVNTGIEKEKNSNEIFYNTLRNNNNRNIYLKRQQDLKNSARNINKIKKILSNISDESFNKIKENYQIVKRRLIGLGAGICAGVLAITSFGAGAYKNYQNNLKNNSLVYENDDISIYGSDNQKVESNISYETNLVGFGAEVKETETETNKETESMEINLVGFGAEIKETKTAIETESETLKETEAETKAEETEKIEVETEISTEKILDHFCLEEVTAVPDANFNIESIEVVPNETMEVQNETEVTTEAPEVEETSTKLNEIKDEKDLLNTYKNELQNLEALLPQSNIELENVRNIGDIVNVTNDANLQNDEYSLIKHSEGHQSVHKDTLPRVICSIIMSDGNSGFTAKTMEEAESLLEQGYYVAGYGVLNPYSKDTSNLEGFFESEDVVGLVRK